MASTLPVPDFGTPVEEPDSGGAGGGHRVERVGLAGPTPRLAVGPVDLHDGKLSARQVAGEAGAVGAGPLDTDAQHRPERTEPRDQPGVASLGGRKRVDAEHATDLVDNCCDVHLQVGVDTSGDTTLLLYDGHGHPFALNGQGVARTCREGDQRTPGPVGADPDQSPPDR